VNVLLTIATSLLTAVIGAAALVLLQRWAAARHWFLVRPLRKQARKSGARSSRAICLGQALISAQEISTGADVILTLKQLDPAAADLSEAAEVTDLLRAFARPGAHGLVSRLVFSEEERNARARAVAALEALEPFVRVKQLDDAATASGRRLGDLATWATGAPVLLDSLNAQARVVHDVHVWHRSAYRGRAGSIGTTYDESHALPCLAESTLLQPGDYDARVLTLDACSYGKDPATGEMSFVLETSESCYAATEQGDQPWGCKHLRNLTSRSVGICFHGMARRVRSGSRLCLVTSFVAVLTGDRQLVLCKRSSTVRHEPGVISATAGGVCELGGSGIGDRDRLGWPDPIESARRELREELGLRVSRQSIRPAVFFLANSTNAARGGDGQLVATLLSLVRIRQTFDEVTRRLWTSSDLASGRFEVDDLVPIRMAGSADNVADQLTPLLSDLNQHGLMSAIYAAAAIWGRTPTEEAFTRVLEKENPVAARMCVDPKYLINPGCAASA